MKPKLRIKYRKYLLLSMLMILLVGCSGTTPPAKELGVHILIEGKGTQLSRFKQAGYYPISVGAEIRRGDMLEPQAGQYAKILCADFTLQTLYQKDACPCSSNKSIITYDGYEVYRPMGASPIIPYILHPRRTAILDLQPVLKWHNTGARSYTVSLQDTEGNKLWEEKSVEDTQILYPGNPPLQTDKKYELIVIDNDTGDSSNDDPMIGLTFWLLDDESIKIIEGGKEKIEGLDMSETSQVFATAIYLATQDVYWKALSLLDSISTTWPTPAVHLWRGHMYGEMRLNDEAKAAYTQALEYATTTGDIYFQAEANGGLWCITQKQEFYDTAMELYSKMGESDPQWVCETNTQ